METQAPYQNLATRHNQGKLQWSLIDYDSLAPMVRVLEFGKKRYGLYNWKKGLETRAVCESMLRHLFAYLDGEDLDKESGLPHIGHIQANAMFLAYMDKNKPHLDNREVKECCNSNDKLYVNLMNGDYICKNQCKSTVDRKV